jgi:hypothetical protein
MSLRVNDPDPNISGEGRLRFESGSILIEEEQEEAVVIFKPLLLALLLLIQEVLLEQVLRRTGTKDERQGVKLDATKNMVVRNE